MDVKTVFSLFKEGSKSDFFKNIKDYKTIEKSGLFDSEFYQSNYDCSGKDPLLHYLLYGYKENFVPNFNFDTYKYSNKYMNTLDNPILHYLNNPDNEIEKLDKEELLNEIIAKNTSNLTNFELDEPLVSIIILNKNGIHHLKKLFKNFKENTNYKNYEIIIVDNNSVDDSVEYLKTLDLPIKIIENKYNQSFSRANNEGFKESNGDLILLMNNDMETTYGWLNEMVGTFLEHENVGAVGPKLIYPYLLQDRENSYSIQSAGDSFRELMDLYSPFNNNKNIKIWDESVNVLKTVVGVTGAVFLTSREIYEELNGLDEDYYYCYEDVDLCIKLNNAGYDILYCPKSLIIHYESPTRKLDNNLRENIITNRKTINKKWGDYLFRNILCDKLDKRNFYTENNLKISIVTDNPENSQEKRVIDSLKEKYEVVIISDLSKHTFDVDVDIIVSLTPEYDILKVASKNNTLKIPWILDENPEWLNQIEYYDYTIYSNRHLGDKINNSVFIDLKGNDIVEDFVNSVKNHVGIE